MVPLRLFIQVKLMVQPVRLPEAQSQTGVSRLWYPKLIVLWSFLLSTLLELMMTLYPKDEQFQNQCKLAIKAMNT
jgi:hypothetical protein